MFSCSCSPHRYDASARGAYRGSSALRQAGTQRAGAVPPAPAGVQFACVGWAEHGRFRYRQVREHARTGGLGPRLTTATPSRCVRGPPSSSHNWGGCLASRQCEIRHLNKCAAAAGQAAVTSAARAIFLFAAARHAHACAAHEQRACRLAAAHLHAVQARLNHVVSCACRWTCMLVHGVLHT